MEDLLKKKFLAFHISGGTTDLVLCEPDADAIIKVTPISCSSDLKAGQAVDRIGVKMEDTIIKKMTEVKYTGSSNPTVIPF